MLPIVVGGCHRTGTSLVRRILDAHPRIHCGPEVLFFRDFYGDYRDDPLRHLRFAETVRSILPEEEALDVLGRALVEIHERAAKRAGKVRWADKAPENALHTAEWERLLGERWLFVHVVRNPLDTVASMRGRFPLTLPEDVAGQAEHYRRYTAAGLAFAGRHPERSFVLVYERLCSEPEQTLGALMTHLGEELDGRQLAFNDEPHQAGLEDPLVGETVEVHRASVGRWRSVLSPRRPRPSGPAPERCGARSTRSSSSLPDRRVTAVVVSTATGFQGSRHRRSPQSLQRHPRCPERSRVPIISASRKKRYGGGAMTSYRSIAVALVAMAALLAGSAIASGAASIKIINFSAKYNGTATVKVTGEVVDSIAAKGTGTGVPIGKGTITGLGKGEAKPQPCNNWGGTGVLKGTKGTITFKMLAGTQGCGDEEGNFFSVVGRAVVTKATGKLAKAKGNLKVTGSFDRAAGTFTAKVTQKLKQ